MAKHYSQVEPVVGWWFDYAAVYDRLAASLPPNPRVVEVGSWLGRSTVYLAEALRKFSAQPEVFSVDICKGPYDDPYMDPRCQEHGGNIAGGLYGNLIACEVTDIVTMLVGPSTRIAKLFEDESIDGLWIDGAHDYNSVMSDFVAWWPKLKKGGYAGGHDYGDEMWVDVKKAIDDFRGGVRDYVNFETYGPRSCLGMKAL